MAANNRIHYAIQQVGFKKDSSPGDSYTAAHGVQSASVGTNFNVRQVFELGQLSIYDHIEEIPDIEITLNKVLDAYPLLFHLATMDSTTSDPTLSGRSNTRTFVALSIFSDTLSYATGTADSIVQNSGMYVSSVGYNFPLEDNFNEDLTLVGNDKIWLADPKIVNPAASGIAASLSFDGAFDGDDSPQTTEGVNRRQHLDFSYTSANGLDVNGMVKDPDATILPPEVFGISDSGTNELQNNVYAAHISNITVSADFGRESIFELGQKAPYHRNVAFPVEVTCEIEVTSTSGDMVSATEAGIYTVGSTTCEDLGNLKDRTIRIATCEGTRIYLGTKNKLSSVNYGGGDAGGGNVAVSYTFTTFNDLTILHSGDPHASGNTWWSNRIQWLTD